MISLNSQRPIRLVLALAFALVAYAGVTGSPAAHAESGQEQSASLRQQEAKARADASDLQLKRTAALKSADGKDALQRDAQRKATSLKASAGAKAKAAKKAARKASKLKTPKYKKAAARAQKIARQAKSKAKTWQQYAAKRTSQVAAIRKQAAQLSTQIDALIVKADDLKAQADAMDKYASNQEQLEDILAGRGIQGAQVVYSKNGKSESHVYGVLNATTGAPVQEDSIFSAASMGKVVESYIALRRVEQGVIDLDTPLWEYYESPRAAGNELAKTITARMVLNHTTGLPNWSGAAGGDVAPLVPASTPGTKYGYSGDGFYLLQKTIEHLDGKPFETTLQDEVFEPFDMPSSSLVTHPELADRVSIGHSADGTLSAPTNYTNGVSAYTLQTNGHDYNNFLQKAVIQGVGLSKEMHEMWFSPSSDAVRSATNPANPYVKWGLGTGLQTNKNGSAVWHWGDNGNKKAFFLAFPDRNESIVMFWNNTNGQQTANSILSLFLGAQAFHSVTWVG